MENWNDTMFAAMNTDNNKFLSLFYLITWIFMGNYVLANIFLAILLDGFDEDALQEDFEDLEQGIEIAPDLNLNHGESTMGLSSTQGLSKTSIGLSSSSSKKQLLNDGQNPEDAPEDKSVHGSSHAPGNVGGQGEQDQNLTSQLQQISPNALIGSDKNSSDQQGSNEKKSDGDGQLGKAGEDALPSDAQQLQR